jgi:hypothetical protein
VRRTNVAGRFSARTLRDREVQRDLSPAMTSGLSNRGMCALPEFDRSFSGSSPTRPRHRGRPTKRPCESAPKVDPVRNGGKCLTLLANSQREWGHHRRRS